MWDGESPTRNIEHDALADLRVEYAANKNNRPFLTRGKETTNNGRPVKGAKNTRIDILAAILADGCRLRDERIASIDANAIDRLTTGQMVTLTVTYKKEVYRVDGRISSYDRRDDTYTVTGKVCGKDFSVTRNRNYIIAITDMGSETTEYMRCGRAQRDKRFIDLSIIVACAALSREGVAWLKYRFDSIIDDTNKVSFKARSKAMGYSLQSKALARAKKAASARKSTAKPIDRTSKGRPTGKSNPLAVGPSYWLTKDQMDMLKTLKSSVMSMRSYWSDLTLEKAISFEGKMFPRSTNGSSVGTRKATRNGTPVAMPYCMDSLSRDGEYSRADYMPRAQSTIRIALDAGKRTKHVANASSLQQWISNEQTKAPEYNSTVALVKHLIDVFMFSCGDDNNYRSLVAYLKSKPVKVVERMK
jgi:hypothetical protein